MPSNRHEVHDYESCFPCKWFERKLWMSGRHPIYNSYCQHPKSAEGWTYRPEHGQLIGENTDVRPQWCPIRGDKQAEKEAKEGSPLYVPGLDDENDQS